MSENSLIGFPAIPLWESTLVKELLFNRNNIALVSIMLLSVLMIRYE